MGPIWEYRWAFVEKGYWGGRKETNFYMTDAEAEKWWASGMEGTERLEEAKRDRNTTKVDWSASSYGSLKPWNFGGVHYD